MRHPAAMAGTGSGTDERLGTDDDATRQGDPRLSLQEGDILRPAAHNEWNVLSAKPWSKRPGPSLAVIVPQTIPSIVLQRARVFLY